jgi:hypothetical protein
LKSSGGIVPFVKAVGTNPGEARTGRALKRKKSQGGESTARVRRGESRNPADRWILEKLREGLNLRRRRKDQSHRGSAFGVCEVRVSYSLKSRVAISRFNRSRRLRQGQVARDPGESGFGTSAFSESKGPRRNSETPSCDGSHRDSVEH